MKNVSNKKRYIIAITILLVVTAALITISYWQHAKGEKGFKGDVYKSYNCYSKNIFPFQECFCFCADKNSTLGQYEKCVVANKCEMID